MQLKQINKARYRKHLNRVIIGCIILLTALSLGISTTAIYLFTDREGTHFWHNLAGVAAAVIIIVQILKKYQHHDYLTEIKYVWDLKQVLNLITRQNTKIQQAADNNERDALLITLFSYKGSMQVYQLDDNTITMSELNRKLSVLEEKIADLNLDIQVEQFDKTLLEQYK
ncbi:DUF3087 domain-containing protein [Catenovulum sp. SM1970]|uniref:DUF3087 family protein n=1 Tax=Marinifaba aquimaris TaxID=2741323 RepID=UPI001573EE8B|nr:DUF3087 domain-containing protein [Marinifaba aquimaris]